MTSGEHPNCRRADKKNLKPFKKGENITHGKTGKRISTRLKEILNKNLTLKNPFTHEMEKKTGSEWVALMIVAHALKGNSKAMEILLDRTEGKVLSKVDMSVSESMSIQIIKQQIRLKNDKNCK
ncbi:MAG: hypothetical protein PVJ67_04005 [Candidatus Pacearchaeota archaeon]|jgi:hypothetical protein